MFHSQLKSLSCAASVTDTYPLHVSLFIFSLSPFLLSMTPGWREYPLGVSLFRKIPLRNGYNCAVADTRFVVAVAIESKYFILSALRVEFNIGPLQAEINHCSQKAVDHSNIQVHLVSKKLLIFRPLRTLGQEQGDLI